MSKINSLCLIRLSALGDCINAFGLLCALKRTYPSLDLQWVIDKRFASLFCDEQGHDLIPMLRTDFKDQGIRSVFSLKKELQAVHPEPFDALLNVQTSIKSSACSLVINAKNKYGFDSERSREGQRFFVNHIVPSPENPHVLAGFLQFAKACGVPVAEPYWDFGLDPYLLEKARCTLGRDAKICAISPCSAMKAKNWSIDGYVEVADYAKSQGMEVILLGGHTPLELEACDTIAKRCPFALNLCGKTNLRELAAWLTVARILIAPDSGSMHLASAVGTPVIGLFAIHNDMRVGPWNFMDLNVSVYEKMAEEELKSTEIPWRYRVRNAHAMEHITTDMVLSTFDKALERYRIL